MLTMPEVSQIVKVEMLQDKTSDNPRWTQAALKELKKEYLDAQISKESGTHANDLSAAQDIAALANRFDKDVSSNLPCSVLASVALMANN